MDPMKNLKRRLKVKKSMKGLPTAGGFKKSLKLKGRAKGMSFGKTKGYLNHRGVGGQGLPQGPVEGPAPLSIRSMSWRRLLGRWRRSDEARTELARDSATEDQGSTRCFS